MAILPIVTVPAEILRTPAKPVATITKQTEKLLDDMLATMYAAPGIGLAAPQIGVLERLVVIDIGARDGGKGEIFKMINPEITWKSEDESVYEEGCLSIPGIHAEVTRPASIRVRYMDVSGKIQEIETGGLLATCVQHEFDHLNGVLFIDYLSKLKQGMIMRKMKKLKAEQPMRIPTDPTHEL